MDTEKNLSHTTPVYTVSLWYVTLIFNLIWAFIYERRTVLSDTLSVSTLTLKYTGSLIFVVCVGSDRFHCIMMLNDWLLSMTDCYISVLTCKQWCFCRKTSSNNCCEIAVQPNGKIKRLNLRSDWVQLFSFAIFFLFFFFSYYIVDPCDEKPCLHFGNCVPSNDLKNFTCICSGKTSGRFCQISVVKGELEFPCFKGGWVSCAC